MDKRGQAMLIVVILLLGILITKSIYFDDVGRLEGEREQYKKYALEIAPIQNTSLLEKMGMLTYRVIYVVREEGGSTDITYKEPESGVWKKETLQGQYGAKVRAYVLYIFPVKDIHIKGGIQEWKQH